MERYFVDERVGCIAVRDRENTDPDYNGLHSDTKGVVKFWEGIHKYPTCTCGNSEYQIPNEIRENAYDFCATLNSVNSDTL